jgi:hypothetical protein
MDSQLRKALVEKARPLVAQARRALMAHLAPLAEKCAALLDECGSENEFRLRCAASNEDPEEKFRPYGQYAAFANGYDRLGLRTDSFRLSDWWSFEKVPGANKPDPWLRNTCDRLK